MNTTTLPKPTVITATVPVVCKNGTEPNVPENVRPLFEALISGRKVKSVTCFVGKINSNDPTQDFRIEDFTAQTYIIGASAYHHTNYDLVVADKIGDGNRGTFFLPWVKEFELYP